MSQRFDQIEARLKRGRDTLVLLDDALKLYRDRHLNDQLKLRSAPHRLLSVFATDPDLGIPHRKILEYLLRQFDYDAQCFSCVATTKLAKCARVGSGRLLQYMELLVRKGYVVQGSDGYRVTYKINAPEL